jgi:hypothetical protein
MDIDRLHAMFGSIPENACLVFNCQQGKGRTTVGMVAAVLFLSAQVCSFSAQVSCMVTQDKSVIVFGMRSCTCCYHDYLLACPVHHVQLNC